MGNDCIVALEGAVSLIRDSLCLIKIRYTIDTVYDNLKDEHETNTQEKTSFNRCLF